MSDRRPHWDAELLDAVGRSMHAFYDRPDAMHVYAVIAAAEDWQKAHPSLDRKDRAAFSDLIATFAARAESAELQVQAVRELHASFGVPNRAVRCRADRLAARPRPERHPASHRRHGHRRTRRRDPARSVDVNHDLLPIGQLGLHPIESMIVAAVTDQGQWVRQCSCRTLINGVDEVDLHCKYREHLAAVAATP